MRGLIRVLRQTWLGIAAGGQDISREVSTMALKIKSASRSSASTAFLKLHSWQPAWDHSSLLPFHQLRYTTCSTNPRLIPIIWNVPRETQPKRKLVRESEVQMWKIHPFSSFYYHTIMLSSTLNSEVDKANGWHVPPVVTQYDYGSSADCKHQSHRDPTGSPQ